MLVDYIHTARMTHRSSLNHDNDADAADAGAPRCHDDVDAVTSRTQQSVNAVQLI